MSGYPVSPIQRSNGNLNALINGNFDIWQRYGSSPSFTLSDVTVAFGADRWYDYVDRNAGTLPTLTRSRQALTPGDIPGAFYFSRLNTNGAGTSLGNSSLSLYNQAIENGTRFLCGAGKQVTVSFWARSSISNKKLGLYLYQTYGTGGAPSSGEYIQGQVVTLTSTWTKYSFTFTTNTLVGKTFGTNNDDSLRVDFVNQWGSSIGTARLNGAAAETYVGSGNIDIAQVQLNTGNSALEYIPRSQHEELLLCQRYYERLTNTGASLQFVKAASAYSRWILAWKVQKRTSTPTVAVKDVNANVARISTYTASDVVTHNRTYIGVGGNENFFIVTVNNTDSDVGGAFSEITCDAELT